MLVKAKKQIVSNPQAVHEVLSKVLSAVFALVNIRQRQRGDDLNNGSQRG
jgi:uroporphyrinogen-III decarboxylase